MQQTMIVTGGAGFIGSHLVDRLLEMDYQVIAIDNLIRGRRGNLATALNSPAFELLESDCSSFEECDPRLSQLLADKDVDTVWHMAANSDINAGIENPDIDLRDTFLTTHTTIKLMRKYGLRRIAFASSSAIYGENVLPLAEDTGPLLPISNYGAMKLASEAVISAAVESFLEQAWIYRFPNVVGSRATHGVIYDLVKKLLADPEELEVLGDGRQLKPYLHVEELVDAMIYIWQHSAESMNVFNISGEEGGITVELIAKEILKLMSPEKEIRYLGGEKGWVGDVPCFEYSTKKLKTLGWTPKLDSNQAVMRAIREIIEETGG